MSKNDKTSKITARQRRFIDKYLLSMNAAEAARTAGYSQKAARQVGQRLLTNADIRTEIELGLDAIQEQQRRALIVLADAAVSALQDVVLNGRGLAKVNAANSILDRSGHKPVDHVKSDVNANVTADISVEDARAELIKKFNSSYPLPETENDADIESKPADNQGTTE